MQSRQSKDDLVICIRYRLASIQCLNRRKKLDYVFEFTDMFLSQFEGLCSMKSSSETLQNLPYFYHMKTHVVFFPFSFRATLFFPLMNALVYVDIDQGIH